MYCTCIQLYLHVNLPLISLNRYHTTLLAKYTGDLITFGQGLKGQLGNGTTYNSEQCIPVMGRWCSPKRYLRSTPPSNSKVVKGVFAGGNHTFATVLLPDQEEVRLKGG